MVQKTLKNVYIVRYTINLQHNFIPMNIITLMNEIVDPIDEIIFHVVLVSG